jgi:DNA-binding response OmpR family regulator
MIKILAVDDEPGICEILKKTFKPIGFTVLTANSGLDAVSIVKKEKPKLVFLDVRMLGMSGLEVLKEIKKIDSAIKVFMLTVMDDDATKREAIKSGADGFIGKPFMSDYLEEVVRKEVAELINKGGINAQS